MPGMAINVFVSRRRLSVSLADVRAAVAEAARQSVRDQLIQHAGKRLVLHEHKSEFTHDTVHRCFRDGRSFEEFIRNIRSGQLDPLKHHQERGHRSLMWRSTAVAQE